MRGNDARARQLLGEAEQKMNRAFGKERDAKSYEDAVSNIYSCIQLYLS